MKKIFIYYSLTGNGDLVADYFKEKGYEIRKVVSKSKYPKGMFWLMMVGGFKAATKKKDKLINFNSDISLYDEVVIGSPIWNDRLCAPINRVIDEIDLKGKKVTFVFYSGGGKADTASERIKKMYDANIIILKQPTKNKDELKKLDIL